MPQKGLISKEKAYKPEAGEMTQWKKYLLDKHESQRWDSQYLHRMPGRRGNPSVNPSPQEEEIRIPGAN